MLPSGWKEEGLEEFCFFIYLLDKQGKFYYDDNVNRRLACFYLLNIITDF